MVMKINLSLCIINGRKTGDLMGNFTSFQSGGNSVIDYVIVSNSLFYNVLTFSVVDFKPWLSDHCSIHYTLDVGQIGEENRDSETSTLHPRPPRGTGMNIHPKHLKHT